MLFAGYKNLSKFQIDLFKFVLSKKIRLIIDFQFLLVPEITLFILKFWTGY